MTIKIDANKILTTIFIAAIVAAFAWMWNINERMAKIESPDSMLSRVAMLEKLIFPIGVEYEIRKRINAMGEESKDDSEDEAPVVGTSPPADPEVREAAEAAEDEVRSMIEQRPIEEARNRRGRPIKFRE